MKLHKFDEYYDKVESIYRDLNKELNEALPLAIIEHVGSSSIPGSLSKGDLDVFVGVDKNDHQKTIDKIKSLGFEEKENTFRSDELCMLVTDKFNYDVAVQVVANESKFENFLRFRDIIRSDSNLLQEYNKIKEEAQGLGEDEYRNQKSIFISKILSKPFIRKARPGDEAEIHEAHMRSIREICVKDHGEDEIKGWGNRELGDRWVEAIKNDFVKVIEFNSKVHGVAYFKVVESETGPFGYIHALYFTPEVTGKGFARELMDEMIEEAKRLELDNIKLGSSITAYNFYKRFGFVPDGDKQMASIGGHPVTCFPMILHLS